MDTIEPFLQQHCLFKAYDIRGHYDKFTTHFVQALSNAFVRLYQAHNVTELVIGYDARLGSQTIAAALAEAFMQQDVTVVWLGLVPTPIMAYWAHQHAGNGIIATASHSSKDILGIKWLLRGESPSSGDIQQLYHSLTLDPDRHHTASCYNTVSNSTVNSSTANNDNNDDNNNDTRSDQQHRGQRVATDAPVHRPYLGAIQHAIQQLQSAQLQPPQQKHSKQKQAQPLCDTLVIDCLNGATSAFVSDVFAAFARQVIVLNDTPDGHFPKGNPDPTEPNRLSELQDAVIKFHADIGLGFDGDGDRLMVVDGSGEVVCADHLLYLLAQIAISDARTLDSSTTADNAYAVIFDVKCVHHLPQMIEQIGAEPIMSRTGSSHMRRAMQVGDSQAIFAGELSGHFMFNDGLFIAHDDAMYAAVRLLNWLSQQRLSLADIVATLPPVISTADIYLDIAQDRQDLIQQLLATCQQLLNSKQHDSTADMSTVAHPLCRQPKAVVSTQPIANGSADELLSDTETLLSVLPPSTRLTTIDGVRLDFQNGFGVIRASNTSASLTVRFAGNTLEDLRQVQHKFVTLCQRLNQTLACDIANICPAV